MKTVATALALAALVATPALAAPKHLSHRTAIESAAGPAYAYQAYDPDVVIVDGRYIGRDPDANVRLALIREANNQDSN
jgi:hypothetical protein